MLLLVKVVNNIFYFYWLLIILRIFLTWLPNINWHQQPIKFVREITDVYLDLFRRIIPPIGMLDISPIIALIALQILQVVVVGIISSIFGVY